jgi:hypothetical protein
VDFQIRLGRARHDGANSDRSRFYFGGHGQL